MGNIEELIKEAKKKSDEKIEKAEKNYEKFKDTPKIIIENETLGKRNEEIAQDKINNKNEKIVKADNEYEKKVNEVKNITKEKINSINKNLKDKINNAKIIQKEKINEAKNKLIKDIMKKDFNNKSHEKKKN